MATALAGGICVGENSMDLEENQAEDTFSDGINIDSFIDEEFSNLFDSGSDVDESLFEDCAPSSSKSSIILAQQLQKLKESNCVDNGEASLVGNEVGERVSVASKEDLDDMSTTSQFCEKCQRLQANNSSSLDSGIGDSQRDVSSVADLREMIVTDKQIVDILEEVGNVWHKLGPILNISRAKLKNIDADYQHNAAKADCLLTTWKEQEGKNATVGNLESALLRIRRKDIADKFLEIVGISAYNVQPIKVIDKPLNLIVRVGLTTEYAQPDTSVLLCEDGTGRRYLVKEITDEKNDWNIEKIVDNEKVMERMIIAARNSRKTKEQRREESLRRVSKELTELRRKMRRVRIESEEEETDQDNPKPRPKSDSVNSENKISPAESREMLRMCILQSENSQMMYKTLIKLIGEVGPLEGNSRCLRQLSDFTNELKEQEKKLIPKLYMLNALKDNLEEKQIAILERLQKWQQTQNKQVEGIDKLITSLLEQGKIQWKRKKSNRKSEPIFNKIGGSLGVRRGRAKTDSGESKKQFLTSLQDEEKKKQISSPLCARQMQKM